MSKEIEEIVDLEAFCDEYIKPDYKENHPDDYVFIKEALVQRFKDLSTKAREEGKIESLSLILGTNFPPNPDNKEACELWRQIENRHQNLKQKE